MQSHVATLNAIGRERLVRREVLRIAHSAGQCVEVARVFDAGQPKRQLGNRVESDGTANNAELDRKTHAAQQIAILINTPVRQRAVLAIARRPGVRTGLSRAPIVARCDDDSVNAVHDALVVCRGTVRVEHGEFVGRDDAVAHVHGLSLVSAKLGQRYAHLCVNQRRVRKIGQDAQVRSRLGDAAYEWRHLFANRVDEVCAHRIARVDEQVHDEHVPARRPRIGAQRQVTYTAATFDEVREPGIGRVEELHARRDASCPRRLGVGHIE